MAEAGWSADQYHETDAPEGFEYTGEYRKPRVGEFFPIFREDYDSAPRALEQTASPEVGHAQVGDGLGYVDAARRILRRIPEKVVSVRSEPRGPYPVEVVFANGDSRILTVEEAEDLVGDLREEIASVKEHIEGPFVQVRYGPDEHGFLAPRVGVYTYRDPSRSLQVGDLVEVPVRYGTKVGRVVELGRGNWSGPVKDVAARLTREEL